jgi:hypothetical protein
MDGPSSEESVGWEFSGIGSILTVLCTAPFSTESHGKETRHKHEDERSEKVKEFLTNSWGQRKMHKVCCTLSNPNRRSIKVFDNYTNVVDKL